MESEKKFLKLLKNVWIWNLGISYKDFKKNLSDLFYFFNL